MMRRVDSQLQMSRSRPLEPQTESTDEFGHTHEKPTSRGYQWAAVGSSSPQKRA